MERIILASASPRRQSLLNQAGIQFEQMNVDVDENIEDNLIPSDIVKILSMKKAMYALEKVFAEKIAEKHERTIIIAADTIVSLDGQIMGKPKNGQDAFLMLNKLKNKCHSVYTGLSVIIKERGDNEFAAKNITDKTSVYMRNYEDEEIWAYIKTGEPFDKAGSYGIQEKGALLVEKIEGDYYTVVGLPLAKLCTMLKSVGVNVF